MNLSRAIEENIEVNAYGGYKEEERVKGKTKNKPALRRCFCMNAWQHVLVGTVAPNPSLAPISFMSLGRNFHTTKLQTL